MVDDHGMDPKGRIALVAAGLVFAAIMVVSLALALSANIALQSPPKPQTSAAAYVLVEVVEGRNTTYATTFVTTPRESVVVVVYPEVLVVVGKNTTYTVTTTVTTTSTTWV